MSAQKEYIAISFAPSDNYGSKTVLFDYVKLKEIVSLEFLIAENKKPVDERTKFDKKFKLDLNSDTNIFDILYKSMIVDSISISVDESYDCSKYKIVYILQVFM